MRYVCVQSTISFLFVVVLVCQDIHAQDRLARLRDLTSNSEMILVWTEDMAQGASDEYINMRIYDLDLTQSDLSQRLTRQPIHTDSLVTGNRRVAVAAGNFLGGELKNFVGAWTGPDNTITIAVPDIDPETLSWTDAEHVSIPGPISTRQNAKLHLAVGDFLGASRQDEFVVAYEGDDGTLNLHLYEFGAGTLMPDPLGSIGDEAVLTTVVGSWDLVSGDFDGDSFHELVLTWVEDLGSNDFSLYAKIYDVDSAGNILPISSSEIFPRPSFQVNGTIVSSVAGDFDNDAELEVAFGFSFSQDDPEPDSYIYLLDISTDLSTITFADSMRLAIDLHNESTLENFNIAAGDLNANQRDELVLAARGALSIVAVEENLAPVVVATSGSEEPEDAIDSDYFLSISDMDADGRGEIVTAGSFEADGPNEEMWLTLRASSYDTSAVPIIQTIGSRSKEVPVSNNFNPRHYAMALGDFDADRMWLGMPVEHSRKGIMRPTVVLNTPPIHYDILDGTTYDLSACFPNQGCGFSATYTQTSANELTVSFETHEDWGASTTLNVEAEAVKIKAKETYGEKFSLKSTSSETKTITTGRVAEGDDWIFTSIYDIDFYEYPVYDGQDPTPIGFFIVSVPGPVRPLWIEAKDDVLLGNQFRPDHEVGNVLSYRTVNTSDVASPIVEFQEQTVGATGSSSASLLLSSFTQSDAETSWDSSTEVGAEVGLSVDIYGIEIGETVEVSGTYSMGEVTTQTVKVESSLEMKSDFGNLDQQFGTSGTYQITPYAYWTQYGAIAIDYKVTLPTGPGSFWDQWYGGKTDPGFSMPWRYDVDKGDPLPFNDPSYVTRSRDIVLDRPDPEPGDTVRVGARVRNLGLADLLTPVLVEFFDEDPASGGELITSTEVDSIDSQSSKNVFVEWAIPPSASLQDKRIYVVLDSDNRITDEVHTNNNVGWAPVVAFGTATGVEPLPGRYTGLLLHQNYPNPFRSGTTIGYELPNSGSVQVAVYDLLGRMVRELVDADLPSGLHEVYFDGSGLPSGVYFARVQAGAASEAIQVVLVK